MKQSFEELVESLKKSRRECPWASQQEIEKHVIELKKEVGEIIEAVGKKDYKNLKEELGDALMDLLFIGVIAEEKGHFNIKDVIDGVKEKLVRRKPWIYGNEIVKTKEEAVKRWNEIKALEKNGCA